MTDAVAESEELARGVLDSTVAKKARKEQMLPSAFMEREGVCTISVLRTSIASDAEVVRIGERMARNRGPNRTIYGWFVVSARNAALMGRQLEATKVEGNPYHADIVLPDNDCMDKLRRLQHAQSLASHAEWREFGDVKSHGDRNPRYNRNTYD